MASPTTGDATLQLGTLVGVHLYEASLVRRARLSEETAAPNVSLDEPRAKIDFENSRFEIVAKVTVTGAFGPDDEMYVEAACAVLGAWRSDSPIPTSGKLSISEVYEVLYPHARAVIAQMLALTEVGFPPVPDFKDIVEHQESVRSKQVESSTTK